MRIIIPYLILCLGVICNAELRTWTAVNGKKVEAEFVSNEKGIVKLKLKSSKVFEVPLNKLSKSDQDFLKAKPSSGSLAENIVGRLITFESDNSLIQLLFNEDGVMMHGDGGDLKDQRLSYKIEGNEVLVFQDEERDGGVSFSSSRPKVGDQVEVGPKEEKKSAKITKIESADKILNDPVRQKRAAVKAVKSGKTKNINLIRQLYTSLYTQFGKDGKLPDGPLEKIIIAEVGTDELTRIKNPETGETRQVLYNLLTDFNPKHIILASPWVYGNQRWVFYGDGSGEQINEERYQQEIQKDEVEMRPLK